MTPHPEDEDDIEHRRAALVERLRRDRGGSAHEEWEWAAHLDVDFMEVYAEFSQALLDPDYPRRLERTTRGLIQAVLLASRGITSSLPGHIGRLLDDGVLPEAILEAFEAAILPTGAPTFFLEVGALQRALDARDAA